MYDSFQSPSSLSIVISYLVSGQEEEFWVITLTFSGYQSLAGAVGSMITQGRSRVHIYCYEV